MSELRKKKHKARSDKAIAKSSTKTNKKPVQPTLSLLADDLSALNPTLSSLFAVKQPPIKAKPAAETERRRANPEEPSSNEDNDAELSELDESLDDGDGAAEAVKSSISDVRASAEDLEATAEGGEEAKPKRKRKRKDAEEDLEAAYMSRLVREEEKEAARLAAERAAKRQKLEEEVVSEESDECLELPDAAQPDAEDDSAMEEDADIISSPPKHETEQQTDKELAKANRTVFLGNVSTDAITSKASRKTLLNHLGSFFDQIKTPDGSSKPLIESLRFRSTAYATAMPKKAAFAKKELMDATTKSTNAYAVYSSQSLAREAAKRLNGTIVLERHLRADEIAHPAKIDHRRCVFVGNLGFVDDESNIQDANEEEGREKRKRGKEPADVEEGLWRTFGKCGRVESVRVIRDSKTRVGKGIAYVQFADENGVEAALLLNEKKFPPLLPRKLRVSRAKAQKRNAKPESHQPSPSKPSLGEYRRKITSEEGSTMGRAAKLLGRAAAAQVQRTQRPQKARSTTQPKGRALSAGIKKPESFIFEGHRATSKQGKSGLKLAGKHTKNKTRVTKRSQSFKASKKKTA